MAMRASEFHVRDVPRVAAKRELLDHFVDHGPQYPSDAARALRLDTLLVLDLCDELEAEGLLEE